MITTSDLRARAACSVSYATEPGSAPCLCAITSTPTLPPHACSCSIAAALKVSAAPTRTLCPASAYIRASFALPVVLPAPFTPTIIITSGFSRTSSALSTASKSTSAIISSFKSASASRGSDMRSRRTPSRRLSISLNVASTPTSADMSSSSNSSQSSSSMRERRNKPVICPKNVRRVLAAASAVFTSSCLSDRRRNLSILYLAITLSAFNYLGLSTATAPSGAPKSFAYFFSKSSVPPYRPPACARP